jgi:chromosome partitioning protein
MASFREMCFTPAEFANIAKIDRNQLSTLESMGLLKTIKRRIGNVDRKMIALEDMQSYFKTLRSGDFGRHGDQICNTVEQAIANFDAETENSVHETMPTDIEHSLEQNPEQVTEQSIENHDSDLVAAATLFTPGFPKYKTQMFYNVKGGTGKSTITAQYVMRAAMMGYRVLAIDLDGQGHLTVNLDILDGHERPTIYDVLINDLHISEAIMNVGPGLDLIPANLGLCNIEIPLNNKTRREYRLSEAIAKIAENYDLIVADTNPAASILNGSMLVASDLVNVVCATNPLSFHGMSLVMATIEQMEQEFRRQLAVRIIPNMYDNREVISQEVLGELRSQFEGCCAHTVVNRSADLNEATKRRTTVWDVNAKGVAAQDINNLTEELILN